MSPYESHWKSCPPPQWCRTTQPPAPFLPPTVWSAITDTQGTATLSVLQQNAGIKFGSPLLKAVFQTIQSISNKKIYP